MSMSRAPMARRSSALSPTFVWRRISALTNGSCGQRRRSFGNTQGISALPGTRTSDVEVTNISPHGFWLLLGDEELFVSFVMFPWFRSATVDKLTNVTRPQPHHLYWPDLDIDLAVESIRDPRRFPLVARPGS